MSFKRAVFAVFCFISLMAQAKPLRVGVLVNSAPFSWQESDKIYLGSAVDLFSHIAKELDWDYQFLPLPPRVDEAIDRVYKGEIDVLVGPISVSHQRYLKVDFSRPFFLNNFGIAVKKTDEVNIFHMIFDELMEKIGYIFPFLALFFFIVAICFYIIDNRGRPKTVRRLLPDISNALWETLMILVQGQLLKDSNLMLKRLVLIFWLVPSIVFFSIIIGSVVSTITVLEQNKSQMKYIQKEDLSGKKLSVIKGNIATEEGKKLGAIMIKTASRKEALEMVSDGRVFGTTDDFITLQKATEKHEDLNLTMSTLNLRNDELAFVFKKDYRLLNRFNQKLLYLQDEGFAENICSRHLGDKGNLCVL